MMCAATGIDNQLLMLDAVYDDIMNDPTMTPMMYMKRGFLAPIIDEEGGEHSWQRILKNMH